MKLSSVLGLSLVAAATSVTAPSSQVKDDQVYWLRVFAPGTQWDELPLVNLPRSQSLGMDNFTTSPPTPPVHVVPVSISSSDKIALRVPSITNKAAVANDTYITALINRGSRTAIMKILSMPDPASGSHPAEFTDSPVTETVAPICPGSSQCMNDQWSVLPLDDGVLRSLDLGVWPGHWVAAANVGTEGWGVYWTGSNAERALKERGAQIFNIDIDLVPVG